MSRDDNSLTADMVIVGAGLSGLMAAWRCLDIHKDLTVCLVDQADEIGGDHTWSFNRSDILPHMQDWLDPFIAYSWPKYDVAFPKRVRTLSIEYCSGNSASLLRAVQPHIDSGRLKLHLGVSAERLSATELHLTSGEVLTAKAVCDARGHQPNDNVILGRQKFVGHVIETAQPHGLIHPVIMDATVTQLDGYRFVYCLPFTPTQMLVEDTYYTDDAELDDRVVSSRINEYIHSKGWSDYKIIRKERGVLPITLAVDRGFGTDVSTEEEGPVLLGMRGGYYHAVTGYSLPEAVKSANVLCDMIEQHGPDFGPAMRHEMAYHRVDHYHEETFLRFLNRMLFRAAEPTQRYKVLQRFYCLSEDLIARFYRNRLTKADKIRILAGKPPVPIRKALANLSESAFLTREAGKDMGKDMGKKTGQKTDKDNA